VRHVFLLGLAFVLMALGLGVIIANVHTLTTGVMVFASSAILLSLALAVPAELSAAKSTLAELARSIKDAITTTTPPPPPPPGVT
jgi:hypothetical protein